MGLVSSMTWSPANTTGDDGKGFQLNFVGGSGGRSFSINMMCNVSGNNVSNYWIACRLNLIC
jgi:hypothetical protein